MTAVLTNPTPAPLPEFTGGGGSIDTGAGGGFPGTGAGSGALDSGAGDFTGGGGGFALDVPIGGAGFGDVLPLTGISTIPLALAGLVAAAAGAVMRMSHRKAQPVAAGKAKSLTKTQAKAHAKARARTRLA